MSSEFKLKSALLDSTITNKEIEKQAKAIDTAIQDQYRYNLEQSDIEAKKASYKRVLELRAALRQAEEDFVNINKPKEEPEPEIDHQYDNCYVYDALNNKSIPVNSLGNTDPHEPITTEQQSSIKPVRNRTKVLVNGVWKIQD